MIKTKYIILIVFLLAIYPGFSEAAKKKWTINLQLEEVKIKTSMAEKSLPFKENTFSNDLMEIVWLPEPKGFKFEILNKKDVPIYLLWDKSHFIDEKGNKHKIVHSDFKFVDNPKPLTPTTIAGQQRKNELVYPQDYAIPRLKVEVVQPFSTGRQSPSSATYYEKKEWVKKDIFLKKIILKKMKKMDKDFDITGYLENSRYEILLKIKIQDEEQEYFFIFKSVAEKKN